MNLPELPGQALEVAAANADRPAGPPTQVILAARCRRGGQPYLVRYEWDGERSHYVAAGSYPVGEDYFVESRGGRGGEQVSVRDLRGSPPCPACGDPRWAKCHVCGGLYCCPAKDEWVTCPHCHASGLLEKQDFDVSKAIG
jgi:hypothetical protein